MPVAEADLEKRRDGIAQFAERIFAGGGELGSLIRAKNWDETAFGPVADWPQSLRTAISIMLSSSFAMVVAWGPDFRFFYNDRYRPIIGAKHPSALGTPAKVIFPEAWDFIGPLFERTRQGEAVALDDVLIPLERYGYLENCYFILSYSPIRDESGEVGGMLAVVAETTERVQSERRLKTLRDLARQASDVSTVEAALQGAAQILAENPIDVPFALFYRLEENGRRARLESCTGLPAGGRATAEIIDLTATPENLWPLRDALDTGELTVVNDLLQRFGPLAGGPYPEPANTAVIAALSRPGQPQADGIVVFGVSPRRALDDQYRGFYELAADHILTSIRNSVARQEERERLQKLVELDRAKTLFFSNVSHEFRTPLTLMLGPLEDMRRGSEDKLDSVGQEQLEIVHRNGIRLLRLVNTLLDFSRIEAGRVQASYEPTDLGQLTENLASGFRSAMEKAGLEFCVDCQPIPEPIYVDRDMWEKIVLNLISNAFKFTFQGRIAVTLESLDATVELSVCDTGTGIAPDQLARVFERFHRIEGVQARTHEGTGIGLALVQELVKLHGGSVRAESKVGEGSAFIVSLRKGRAHLPADRIGGSRSLTSTAIGPDSFVEEALRWLPDAGLPDVITERSPEHEPVSPPRTAVVGASAAERPYILVADDNADMRRYLARLLSAHYEVHSVPDGKAALASVRERPPNLILSDVMMPNLDGFGLVQKMRSIPETDAIPIILLSARAGEEARVEGMEQGADDYLIKPFSASELLARVSAHLRLSSIRRQAAQREAELRAKAELERRRLQELLAQAPALIGLLSGPEHRWTYVNDLYIRVTGRIGPEDFLGKTVRESLPEVEGQGFFELLDQVYRTGEPFIGREMKARLNRAATGQTEEAYFNFVYQPILDASGATEGILVHAVEVTDQVLARHKIQQSEEHFRAIVDTTPECVKLVAADGALLHMNSAGLAMVGASCPEMVTGKSIYDVIAPEDRERFREFNERICAGERGVLEFDIVGLQGVRRHMETHAAPLRATDGATVQLAVTLDITQRKQAEKALRESEQRFRVITEASPIMVWMAGTDKLCFYFNTGWLEFVGRTLEQECGNGWTESVHPDDFDRCLQIYVTNFDARLPFEMEYRLRHHTGEYRWILDCGVPRHAPDGTFEGYVGGCLDIHDRKQATEKLRAAGEMVRRNKELLDVALAASDTGTFRWNPHTGEFLEFDQNLKRLFGFEPHDTVRVTEDFIARVHPEDLPKLIPAVNACRDGADFEMEYRVVMPDGGIRWLYDRAKMEWENGSPRYLVGACTDITSRKNVEQALRDSEERLRLAQQAAAIGTFEWNPHTNVNRWTPELEAMYGLPPGGFGGTQEAWEAMVHPDYRPATLQQVEIGLQTGNPIQAEWRVVWPDGSIHWILGRWQAFRDASGKPTRMAGINVDITARKAAEEDQRRLAAIVESSDDAIASKDLNGIVTSWNKSAERLFGLKAEEIIGRPITLIIPPELHSHEETILSKIRRGEKIDHFETVRLNKNGERIEVSVTISPVKDGHGNVVGAAKIIRNITESKKIEHALRTAEKLAAAGRLAATVAHEINNPLEAVTNFIYLAKQTAGPGEVQDYLAGAEEELDRVTHLTKQTLGFYRDTRGATSMSVGALVTPLLSVFSSRARNKGIDVCPEIRQHPEISAVPGEIRQLLANLLSNSIDAVDRGGVIRIRVAASMDWSHPGEPGVRLTVADSGSGIPADIRSKLFEPFFTTKKEVGTGLGLWVCQNIAKKHGGRIRVKSCTAGNRKGTVFSTFFPLRAQSSNLEQDLREAV